MMVFVQVVEKGVIKNFDRLFLAAAECLPCLLICAKVYGDEYLKQMWGVILSAYR